MSESAQRRFHAQFPGGEGYYFPYAEPLEAPFRERFRTMVDARRHGYQFKQDLRNGEYGDPWSLRTHAAQAGIQPEDDDDLDRFMSFVEEVTGRGVEGPLGWGFRGDRPNMWARDPLTGRPAPWLFNRDGRVNGPFYASGRPHHWGGDVQTEDFV
jgi:hypothetical protein